MFYIGANKTTQLIYRLNLRTVWRFPKNNIKIILA